MVCDAVPFGEKFMFCKDRKLDLEDEGITTTPQCRRTTRPNDTQ
jgi:hypothetical protein